MKNHHKFTIYLALAALVFSSLACNLARTLTAGRSTPTPAIAGPLSTTAPEPPQGSGTISLEFTESQLTEMAVEQMGAMGEERVSDLQVHLRDGRITITGSIQRSGFDLPLEIVIQPSITANGKPRFQIVEAYAGPFPIPQDMLEQLSSQMEAMVTSEFDDNIFLTGISVSDGKISIQGTLR